MLRSLLRNPSVQLTTSRRPLPASSASPHQLPHRAISHNAILKVKPPSLASHGRYAAVHLGGTRAFHATPRNDGPLLPIFIGLLKSSTMMEIAGTAARVALTFVPLLLFKNMRAKKYLKKAEQWGMPLTEPKKEYLLRGVKQRTMVFHILIFIPLALFWATIFASSEMTPLSGRWRLILLSPEEEEAIAAQLAGPGWYQAVGEILAQDGSTTLVHPTDWRLSWVEDTLRRLEGVIPTLQHEHELEPKWISCGPNDIPLPPPAEYPLRPRPRASDYLRRFCEHSCGRVVPPPSHCIAGPPYSLIVVDRPDSANAFSYGFGPDGGGGIVVFSGFLDEVLSRHPPLFSDQATEAVPQSWWSSLVGSMFSRPPPSRSRPAPSDEATAELAILLAHELAHLLLSHHIETLTNGSILWPGVISIATDVIRALLFPVTMLFGPFVNDALAGMGKVGNGEITKLTEYCTSQVQEIEADIVSARLLAHAGFDPRQALEFWECRKDDPSMTECTPSSAERNADTSHDTLMHKLMGSSHPMNVVRVQKLRIELERWEYERREAREMLHKKPEPSYTALFERLRTLDLA